MDVVSYRKWASLNYRSSRIPGRPVMNLSKIDFAGLRSPFKESRHKNN